MNLDIYTSEMAKSVWDKAFFMDKIIGAKCVIDFGCADGAMIRYLSSLFPDITFVGYDISNELIDRARNTPPFNANLMFLDNTLQDGINFIKEHFTPDEICLNFSSVLHEVFSCSPCGKATIKMLIDELHPKYITVRDMYFLNENSSKIEYTVPEDMYNYAYDFESVYGPIQDNPKQIIHFLMKYQWKDNGWQEELNENYFSWTITDLYLLFGPEYVNTFRNHYQLPYLTELWFDMFFNISVNTHVQLIFRRI